MLALREGGDQRGGPASGPFAEIDPLCVVRCVHLSCSSDSTANAHADESSSVEARFGQSGNFESPHEAVECVSYFPKRSAGLADVVWACVARRVREVRERGFCGCKSLVGVTFGASSKLERICAEAFYETNIESLSIPDSVVELGERCFRGCKSLRCVIFGASSKLERICAEAFYETSIESLFIPDSVVELGERCCCECKSLRSVTFGASSNLERICAEAFRGTSIELLSIPGSVVDLT